MRIRSLLFVLLPALPAACLAQGAGSVADSSLTKTRPKVDSLAAVADTAKKPKPPYVHQFRVGIDIARIPFNLANPNKQSYTVQADYKLRGNLYLYAEAGAGRGKVDYDNLKYTGSNYYFKFGPDMNFLDIISNSDFDIGFLGLHYGGSAGKRNEASYTVKSPFGAPVEGSVPAESYFVHWGEISGGIRVEIFRHIFVGWNGSMRFLLNSGTFSEIAPNHIAGYGAGDKSTAFDVNVFISYAIRWGGK